MHLANSGEDVVGRAAGNRPVVPHQNGAQKPGQLDRATGEFHTFDDAKLKKDIIAARSST
jgi:hypothetical protein